MLFCYKQIATDNVFPAPTINAYERLLTTNMTPHFFLIKTK